jgi:hypothetical protein
MGERDQVHLSGSGSLFLAEVLSLRLLRVRRRRGYNFSSSRLSKLRLRCALLRLRGDWFSRLRLHDCRQQKKKERKKELERVTDKLDRNEKDMVFVSRAWKNASISKHLCDADLYAKKIWKAGKARVGGRGRGGGGQRIRAKRQDEKT